MDDERRIHALTDEAVVMREIERALRVNPSPTFLARVRSRVAEEPVRLRRPFLHAVAWRTAIACVLLAMLAGTLQRVRFGSTAVTPIASPIVHTERSSITVPLRAAVPVEPWTARGTAAAARESLVVVVASDEAAALRRLLSGQVLDVSSGDVSAVTEPSTGSSPATDIVIPLLEIDLLELTKSAEGATP